MKNIYFVIPGSWNIKQSLSRGSAIMRAWSPSWFLKNKFNINSDVLHEKDLNYKEFDIIRENNIVIYIKHIPSFTNNIRKKALCLIDPIDAFEIYDKFKNIHDCLIISPSAYFKNKICEKDNIDPSRVLVIDHLSTYNDVCTNNKNNDKLTIGIVEPSDGSYRKKLKINIAKYCNDNDLNFIYQDTRGIYAFDNKTGNVKNLFNAYNKIDIGISLFDNDGNSGHGFTDGALRRDKKPSTKLSAWSSFEIPCILTYQKSYDQYIEKYKLLDELIIKSNDINEVFELIQKLKNDNNFNKDCKSLMKKLKLEMSMNNVKKLYIDQLTDILEKNNENINK